MEQYENNSLNNCTDNNEFHSQQPADADFKTPREEQPAGGADAAFSQSQPEESDVRAEEIASQDAAQQSETGNEPTGAYHNAGAGRKESPFADSPYVMGEQPRQESGPTGDWETAYHHVKTPKQPKARKPREKKSRSAGRMVAAALACAVIGGVGGGALTAHLVDDRWEKTTAELQSSFQSQLEALGSAKTGNTGSNNVAVNPVSNSGALTPAQVYAQNVNSVVAITNKGVTTGMFGQESFTGTGSGFILTADGYVLTNHHVIDGAQSITVTLSDGTEYTAQLVGSDSVSDVALLKIDGQDLPAVSIGNSDDLEVGDQVAAIGNPLGELTSTQTVGYVSAKDRSVNTDGTIINMLQTDAAINSGNSGGPLFNMNGEVVGITTAKYSGSTSSGASIEGIGFAIPINDVMKLVDDLMEYGYITGQAYLGVTINSKDLDASTAAAYGLPVGARVESVTEGSCAQKAGLQAGDIITALGDQKVSGYSDLVYALRNFSAGDATTVSVYRAGQELTLQITFDEKTADTVTGPVVTTEPTEATGDGEQPSQDEIPESGSYEDWYDYFYRFFGGNGN